MDEKAKKARPSTLCVFVFQYSVTLIVMGTILYGGYYYCHFIPIPRSNDFCEKLLYAVRYCTFPQAVFLILAISTVAAKRAITRAAVNPLAGNEHLVQSEKTVLTNTVEQLLVFLLLVLTLTTYLEPSEMRIIPLYSLTFFIGRVFFMIGYSFGPRYRGAGMYINACLGLFFLGYSIYLIYLHGFMYGVLTDSSHPTIYIRKSELWTVLALFIANWFVVHLPKCINCNHSNHVISTDLNHVPLNLWHWFYFSSGCVMKVRCRAPKVTG